MFSFWCTLPKNGCTGMDKSISIKAHRYLFLYSYSIYIKRCLYEGLYAHHKGVNHKTNSFYEFYKREEQFEFDEPKPQTIDAFFRRLRCVGSYFRKECLLLTEKNMMNCV